MESKKILVTGGAGFIGSNMIQRLLDLGNSVVAYDNLSSGNKAFIKNAFRYQNFRFVEGDILNKQLLEELFSDVKFDLVIHLAANADIVKGMKSPWLDINIGIIGTLNILDVMEKHGVKNIIFSSTSAVYGNASELPTSEDYTDRGKALPVSSYAASKLAAENLIRSYSERAGLGYLIYRFANVVGNNYSHGILIQMVDKLSKSKESLEVIGRGMQKRAYMLVDDLIDAILHTYDKGLRDEVFNVSTDELLSVDQIVRRITDKVSENCVIRYTMDTSPLLGDVVETYISNQKLKNTGFSYKHESHQAVDITIDHLVERFKL